MKSRDNRAYALAGVDIKAADRAKESIKGLAHITGGGFIRNIPRILPHGLAAHIRKDAWEYSTYLQPYSKTGRC